MLVALSCLRISRIRLIRALSNRVIKTNINIFHKMARLMSSPHTRARCYMGLLIIDTYHMLDIDLARNR